MLDQQPTMDPPPKPSGYTGDKHGGRLSRNNNYDTRSGQPNKNGVQYNNNQSVDSVENFGIPESGPMISPDMAFKTIMSQGERNSIEAWDNLDK